MPITTDPDDPGLGHGVDNEPVPQNATHLVLSPEERAKGFVRPVRRSYRHQKCSQVPAGLAVTTMGLALAETYARQPDFYGATYCSWCHMHRPVGEFTWINDDGTDGGVVGS